MPNCLHEVFAGNRGNLRNSRPKTSKYKGVHWHKRLKKWAAAIRCNKKTYHLGYFTNEIEAAKAYDRAARKFHSQFASLNFDQEQVHETQVKGDQRDSPQKKFFRTSLILAEE